MEIQQSGLLALGIALVVLAIGLVTSYYCMQRRQRARYIDGIHWLQQLCQLLALLQQHRGLSNGFLNGDEAAALRISQLQSQIGQQIEVLNRQGVWIHLSDLWLGIQDHWGRLGQSYRHIGARESLAQHNRMIGHMLHLVADCAESHQLHLLEQEQQPVTYLWQDLLGTVEYIGQARALGTGVTAAGCCNSVDRIRLNFLHNRLSSCMSQLQAAPVSGALGNLLETLRHRVIVDLPTIHPGEYFEQASGVMELLMEEFQTGLSQLESQLDRH